MFLCLVQFFPYLCVDVYWLCHVFFFFFFNDTATTEINTYGHTPSLHYALPISTTDLTADQIHELGLKQVAAIHEEMEAIKREVGFKGTLTQFFDHIRTDPRFKYPDTEAGREAYLADARGVIASVMAAAPRYFRVLPKAALEVRAVEKWREATAPTAFYNTPSADGTRPGIYYVNLVDMNQTQKRSEEHTSELQSLMRNSYAVFCLNKKKHT